VKQLLLSLLNETRALQLAVGPKFKLKIKNFVKSERFLQKWKNYYR